MATKRTRVDLEKARHKLKEQEQLAKNRQSSRTSFWRPPVGKSVIRICPPWTAQGPNANQFWREVWLHFGVPPGAEQGKTIMCTNRTPNHSGRCYVCEQVNLLYQSGDPEDIDIAKRIRAKQQFISNIIDMKEKTHDVDGKDIPFVQPYRYGSMIYDELLSYFLDNEYGDITDIDEGFNIIIERTGEGMETRYKVRAMRNPTSWEKEGINERAALSNLIDLDDLKTVHTQYELLDYPDQQLIYDGYQEEPKPVEELSVEDLDDFDDDFEDEDEEEGEEEEEEEGEEDDKELHEELSRAARRRR